MNKFLIMILFFSSLAFSANVETFYTCSMHPKIKEHKPGKCPICHMNLSKMEIEKVEEIVDTRKAAPKVETFYTCSMHPKVKEDKPGKCPICHMNLSKVEIEKEEEQHNHMAASSLNPSDVIAKIKLRKSQQSHFKPDFFPVTTMMMVKKIRLLGSIYQSEEKESNIPARIAGRVEKVFVKSTGSYIKVGDPVVSIYSPKLITAGEEYILARKSSNSSGNREFKEMLAQSVSRLKLWGIKPQQFKKWYKENKVPKNIIIYSSATGIVRKRNAQVGKYFREGQNFFELSDLSDVWVEMDVYEQDSAIVKIGQKVELSFTALPGDKVKGEIDFVSPVLNKKSRTLKIRATIKNASGDLKPGMVADATLTIELPGMPLVVPRSAIIDTGKRKVAWVNSGNSSYKAKIVKTGYESEGYVEVKSGLSEGEEVVTEGNFLLDAQAQLFGGYESISSPTDVHQGH